MVFLERPEDVNSSNNKKTRPGLTPNIIDSLPESVVKQLITLDETELQSFLKYYSSVYIAPLSEDDAGVSVNTEYGTAIFMMIPFAVVFYGVVYMLLNNFSLYQFDSINEYKNYIVWFGAVIGSIVPVITTYVRGKIQKKKIIQADIKDTITENGESAQEILKHIRGYRINTKK